MKRSPLLLSLFFFIVGPVRPVVAAAFGDAEWRFHQDFVVEHSGAMRIAVPLETLDHAQIDLRDLRIQAPDATEVPYALIRPSSAPARWGPVKDFTMTLEEGATVLAIDAGETRVWDFIDLAIRSPRFLKPARLEASIDGKSWEQWNTGVPLFRNAETEQTVLPLRREPARYFRVTLDDRHQSPIVVAGARMREPASEEISLEPIELRIARTDEYAGESWLTLALPAANLDLDALEVITPDSLFTRKVRAGFRQFSEGEIDERTLMTDTIFRIALEDTPSAEKIRAAVGSTIPTRELILHVENGDSPPLHIAEIKGIRRVVYIAFDARETGHYRLWVGNRQAPVPRYDLATMSDSLRKLPPVHVALEALAANANYHHTDPLAGLALLGSAINLADWSHRRAVKIESAGVQLLELDLAALSTAQPSLSDLRLVSGDKQVPYIIERTRLTRMAEFTPSPEPHPKTPNLSLWRVHLPLTRVPLTQLALTTSASLFQRDLRIFERRQTDNGEIYEMDLGRASWQRTPQETPSPLRISLTPPQSADFWIQTDNGDNPPIVLGNVQVYYPVDRVLFLPEPAHEISLLSGNPQAPPPRYDLSLIAQALLASEKKIATLAPASPSDSAETSSGTLPIKTTLFWAALATVVVALLVVVAKLLPKPPASK